MESSGEETVGSVTGVPVFSMPPRPAEASRPTEATDLPPLSRKRQSRAVSLTPASAVTRTITVPRAGIAVGEAIVQLTHRTRRLAEKSRLRSFGHHAYLDAIAAGMTVEEAEVVKREAIEKETPDWYRAHFESPPQKGSGRTPGSPP